MEGPAVASQEGSRVFEGSAELHQTYRGTIKDEDRKSLFKFRPPLTVRPLARYLMDEWPSPPGKLEMMALHAGLEVG